MASEGSRGSDRQGPARCPPPRSPWGCTVFLFSRVYLGLFFSDSHRSIRFRNHSVSSSSAFETSPGRSPCSWPRASQVARPHLQSQQVRREHIFRNSRLRERLFPHPGTCTPAHLLPRLRPLPSPGISQERWKERAQRAQDGQTQADARSREVCLNALQKAGAAGELVAYFGAPAGL